VLHRLPPVMEEADRRARQLESRIVDFAEARLLLERVGEFFEAVVIELRRDGLMVQITDPPVRTFVPAAKFMPGSANFAPSLSEDGTALDIGTVRVTLGQALRLRLDAARPQTGTVDFIPV
jgi:exoribonuclease R